MLRNEVELLDSLAKKIANNIKDPKKNDIVNELLSFVNNELEKVDNIKIDDIPNYICEELLNMLGIEKGEVNVTTPEGKTTITFSKGETPEIKLFDEKGNEMKKCSCGEKQHCSNCENKSSDETKSCTHGSDVMCENCKCEKSSDEDIIEKIYNEVFGKKQNSSEKIKEKSEIELLEDSKVNTIILHNAGGLNNEPFKQAVRFICENYYFNSLVDLDEEANDVETYDKIILLPNVWVKIYEEAADRFAGLIDEGKEVYIFDTETFELIPVEKGYELYNYAMTKMQESLL